MHPTFSPEALTNYTKFKSLFRERRIRSEQREYN